MLTFSALAVALRGIGAVLRAVDSPWAQLPGWLLCLLATWLAAGLFGVAFPLWPAILVGTGGFLLYLWKPELYWIPAADLVLLLWIAVWAVPTPNLVEVGLLAGAVALVWSGVEVGARLLPAPLPIVAGCLALAAGGLLVARVGMPAADPLRPLHRMLPHMAILPACQGERIDLDTGATAWYDPPRAGGARPGAMVFHGADRRGARQPAACSLRRALLDAGFGVLSIDHPGFGASPAPAVDADLSAWDPATQQLAALEWLESRSEITRLGVLAGHSMGALDALRLLARDAEPEAVFLFGMGVGGGGDDPPDEDYWFERFHTDRGMTERLTVDRLQEIGERYYHFDVVIQQVPIAHPPVVFAEFGWEWDDVAATRDPPFRAIPGRKERWTLPHASHYFSTLAWHGLHVVDTRVIRSVSAGLQGYPTDASH